MNKKNALAVEAQLFKNMVFKTENNAINAWPVVSILRAELM